MKYVILILACTLLYGCTRSRDNLHSLHPLSIVDGDSVNHTFRPAEELLARGDYRNSSKEYAQIRQSENLTQEEKTYALLSDGICQQLLDQDTGVVLGTPTLTKKLRPLNSLYEGLKLMNAGGDAQPNLLQAEREFEKLGLSKSLYYLITLNQLGLYHRTYATRVDSSIHYFKKALRLTEEYEVLTQYKIFILFNLAELSLMFRDTMLGMSYVHQALSHPLTDEWQGRFLTLKGTMFRKLLQYDSANRYYELAEGRLSGKGKEAALSELLREKILKAILQNNQHLFSLTINKLNSIDSTKRDPKVNLDRLYGFYYYSMGQPEKSIPHYEKALQILKKQKRYEIVQIGEAYYLLTKQYRLLKDFENAKRCCYEALAYATPLRHSVINGENAFDHRLLMQPNNFILYGLLADVFRDYFLSSNNIEHITASLKICTLIDSLVLAQVHVKEEDAIINYLPYGHRAYSCGIEASYLLYQHTGDTSYIHKAHQFMEKSKSLIIYRDLLSRKKEYFPDVPEEFLDREMELKSKMAALKQQPGSENMTKTLAEMDRYYTLMEEKYPSYYQSKFQMTIPSFEFCQSLSKQKAQTFIQYHVSESAIYFLTYDNTPQFEYVPLDSVFRKKFNALKRLVSEPPTLKKNEAASFAHLSNMIYSKLFKPVKDPKHDVLIIPEGFLSQFPFEVLVTDTAGSFKTFPYLIQGFRLRYAHSLKIYSMPPSPEQNSGINKILGYAHSEKSSNKKSNSLPGSTNDLHSLSTAFPKSSFTFRIGDRATKSQFLHDLQGPYNLIHVAMHASSSVADRNNNKIEFTTSDHESDFLYGYELIPMKLKAHTVVLASCETSSGRQVMGEGTFNLERAFSQMGATTVISSAWQMPDRLGAQVIEFFYRQLQQSPQDMSGSLSRSKLDYLNNADEYTAHPYFWAAFLCVENQRGSL